MYITRSGSRCGWGVLALLATFTWPWTPAHWDIIFARDLFGSWANVRIFGALEWLSSVSVAEVMEKK